MNSERVVHLKPRYFPSTQGVSPLPSKRFQPRPYEFHAFCTRFRSSEPKKAAGKFRQPSQREGAAAA